jgi:hypothetical protein
MYARIATFEGGDASRLDEMIKATADQVDAQFDDPPEGLEGVTEVWMLVDRGSGRGLGVTLYENEDDLRKGDAALNAMSPAEEGSKRTDVAMYEIALRKQRS